MIASVPRPRPPHLQRQTTRNDRVVWYVRVGHGKRTRLRAQFGTPEFEAEYQSALAGEPPAIERKAGAGSLKWLIARYRDTPAWLTLFKATRRQRDNIFRHIIKEAGHEPHIDITRAHVVAGRDRRAATPAQARHFLDTMRGLFRWAVDAEIRKDDPTLDIKNPRKKKGAIGFPAWTEADAEAYEKRWPIGTKERVWFDVLCFIGARRGDAVVVGRQHVRDGVLTWRTEKGGEEVEISIPILPVLDRTLKAGPCGDLAFICGAKGGPFTKESFGNAFSEAARKAGVKKSAHGVRKIAATRAANNGATIHELMAIFGWKTPAMALLYTKEANRRRLGRGAAHLLANETGKSIPSQREEVRDGTRKT